MVNMELTDKQECLLEYVKDMHMNYPTEPKNAFRKYTGEEYWTHPLAVAKIVGEFEPDGVEIALCHDLVEDTDADIFSINRWLLFLGYSRDKASEIAFGVHQLTNTFRTQDYPNTNRKLRKIMEASRLRTISPLAQSVKYGDIIHNGSSVFGKDEGFAKLYLNEATHILDVMDKGNADLLIKCKATIQKEIENLNQKTKVQ